MIRRLCVAVAACALVAGCAPTEPLMLPPAPTPTVSREGVVSSAREEREPTGDVTVAYPAMPSRWVDPTGRDVAADDLAGLWGLPLYRLDPEGQLRPGLVAGVSTRTLENGWQLRLRLRPGRWSDGERVTATDVVATIGALREDRTALRGLRSVTATNPETVRLRFRAPVAGWPHLLTTVGVMPAHVLRDEGLAAFDDEVPVSGGPFRLVDVEAGLSATFAANPDGPLGPPALRRIRVLFTPSFDTALGLLDRGRVDAVLGHVTLNPPGRVAQLDQVDGVEVAAPLGGSWVGLDWRTSEAYGASGAAGLRRAVSRSIGVDELVEGLLDTTGETATSPLPGRDGPWDPEPRSADLEDLDALLVYPDWTEALGFTARLLQGQVDEAGGRLGLRREDSDRFERVATRSADVVLREFRSPPRPVLASLAARPGTRRIEAADAAPGISDGAVDRGLEQLHTEARQQPLYRVGVTHVWRPELSGLAPSSWPGIGFASASAWQDDDGG